MADGSSIAEIAMGRIASLTLGSDIAAYGSECWTFGYDSLNRLTAAALPLTGTLAYTYDGKPNSDPDLLLAYGMPTLLFPVSLLLSAIVGVVGNLAYSMYVVQTSYWSIVLTCPYFFVVGYWQWFRLVPWPIRRMRKRKQATA